MPVAGIRPAADSYQAQANLREGGVDLMVEYTGTARNLLGETAAPGKSSVADLRRLYRPLGLDWLAPLGFDNRYALLVPSGRAASLDLQSIEDLADPDRFPNGIRVACPPEYLRRPGDGLGNLSEAYGFQLASPPQVVSDIVERMRAVQDGRVDVAVGFATDGVIPALGLRVLDDPRGFFPPYEAAFVVRHETSERRPEIVAALDRLSGRLDAATMRELNAMVEIQGRRPSIVAREFLFEQGLIGDEPDRGLILDAIELALAIDRRDEFGELLAKAIIAVRSTFPDRPVTEKPVDDPVEAVARGEARLALMGAERFFLDSDGDASDRETRVEAVAVVGTRLVHLVRRAEDRSSDPLSGRVGVPEAGSGAGIIAQGVLGHERVPEVPGTSVRSLRRFGTSGSMSPILVAPVGDSEAIASAVSEGSLKLRSLPDWLTPSRAVRLPFLRPARIAAGRYAGQEESIETLGVQVLLAGPSRQAVPLTASSGPASALTIAGLPLEPEEVESLARATGVPETPDPTLPSAWSRRPAGPIEGRSTAFAVLSTLLNVLAITFLLWIFHLAFRPARPTASP